MTNEFFDESDSSPIFTAIPIHSYSYAPGTLACRLPCCWPSSWTWSRTSTKAPRCGPIKRPKTHRKKSVNPRWVFGVAAADVISTISLSLYIYICTTIIYIYIHFLGKSPNIAELEQSQWIIRIYLYIYKYLYIIYIYIIHTLLHITYPAAEVKEMLQYRVEIGAEAAVLARFSTRKLGDFTKQKLGFTRPGKQLHNPGKIHHFQWENPLFLWSFSIAMLVYQRVTTKGVFDQPDIGFSPKNMTGIWTWPSHIQSRAPAPNTTKGPIHDYIQKPFP